MQLEPSLRDVSRYASQDFTMIPVGFRISSDLWTPVVAMNELRKMGTPCYLLESAEGGEQVGRYSFLGVSPTRVVKCHGNQLEFTDADGNVSTETFGNIVSALKGLLHQEKAPQYERWPPFLGGAVGYLSYDAVRFVEDVPMPKKRINLNDAYLMFFKETIVFDRLKHQVWFVSHVEPKKGSVKKQYAEAFEKLENLRQKIAASVLNSIKVLSVHDMTDLGHSLKTTPAMGREKFCEGVVKIKQHIRRGDIFQCVLSDAFKFRLKTDPFLIYRILRMVNPSPYLFFIDFIDELLLGSSPELLTRVSDSLVETCPIAGTRPRGHDEAADKRFERDLLKSVKERAEHLMLVDLGRNDIGRVSRIGSVDVTEFMQVQRFSHVMHLVSLVQGRLRRNLTAWDALLACFPAGTLSGAPKIRAMEIISAIETQSRGCYGGAVVAYDYRGNLNSCITIRSLWVKDGYGHIQSGAGVVADSQPNKEYDEVLNKARALKTAVAMSEES